MRYSFGFGVPREHSDEAATLTQRLQDDRWASHVTVGWLLHEWGQLADEVDHYELTIDDYTNDLTARDAIELVLSWSSDTFAAWVAPVVGEADQRFMDRTVPDNNGLLDRYFRIAEDAGWWWRRLPAAGPLSDYLTGP